MHAKEYFTSHEEIDNLSFGEPDMENGYPPDHTPDMGAAEAQSAVPDSEKVELTHTQHPAHVDLGPPGAQDIGMDANLPSVGVVVELLENPHQIKASRKDFYNYMWNDGNWTDLAATSLNWMLLDFTFYLLGVNSSSFVPTMFNQRVGPDQPPYGQLIRNERHIMEATSIGAMIGGAIAIYVMNKFSRKKIQMWGFIILGGLFVVVGAMYMTLPSTKAHLGIVIFYGLCQLFFNLGESMRKRARRSAY